MFCFVCEEMGAVEMIYDGGLSFSKGVVSSKTNNRVVASLDVLAIFFVRCSLFFFCSLCCLFARFIFYFPIMFSVFFWGFRLRPESSFCAFSTQAERHSF